jgi:hypothetical protein
MGVKKRNRSVKNEVNFNIVHKVDSFLKSRKNKSIF